MAVRCDNNDPIFLRVIAGGNGDYYPEIFYRDKADGLNKSIAIRVCTSGSQMPLKVRLAIANLYRALEESEKNGDPWYDIKEWEKENK